MRRRFTDSPSGLYRSRNGIFLGVCRGIADYFDFSVFWVRAVVLVLFMVSGFFPALLIYITAALIMKPDPISARREEGTIHSMMESIRNLSKRMRNVEDCVTSKEYRWHKKYGDL